MRSQIYQTIDDKLQELRNRPTGKKGFVILGNTRVGKSTIFLLLQKISFLTKENGSQTYIQPESPIKKKLVNQSINSYTELPNFERFDESDTYIIDMPGAKDDSYHKRILNSIFISEGIKKMESVHLFVVTELSDQGHPSEDHIEMFTLIMKMFPNAQEHLTICVNKLNPEKTKKDSVRKNLEDAFRHQKDLLHYYRHALAESHHLEIIYAPKRGATTFEISEVTRKYIKDASYIPTSKMVIKASDISDGFQKPNFQKTLMLMKEFIEHKTQNILQLCAQITTSIITIVRDFDFTQKHTIQSLLQLLFFFYQTNSKLVIQDKEKSSDRLQNYMNFFKQLLNKIAKCTGSSLDVEKLKTSLMINIYQVYCFLNVFESNEKVINGTLPNFLSDLETGDLLKIWAIFEKMYSTDSTISPIEAQIYQQLSEGVLELNLSDSIRKQSISEEIQELSVIIERISLLKKVFEHFFSESKNQEGYKRMEQSQHLKKLEEKKGEIKKVIELLELMGKKKFDQTYQLSEKYFQKTQIHKMVIKKYLLWVEKDHHYQLKIKLCEELNYQMKKQQILLSISRHESTTLYNLFVRYGDEYKNAKDPDLAKKLYFCAFQCIENFNPKQEKQIYRKLEELDANN